MPYEGYILDFYTPSLKLCIGLDSLSHDTAEAQAYDAKRSALLAFAAVCAAINAVCGGEVPF